jgi:hypothetical protein
MSKLLAPGSLQQLKSDVGEKKAKPEAKGAAAR